MPESNGDGTERTSGQAGQDIQIKEILREPTAPKPKARANLSTALISGFKQILETSEPSVEQLENLVLIMDNYDFDKVQAEYDLIKFEQQKYQYRARKFLS
jgi:hypothetical protein